MSALDAEGFTLVELMIALALAGLVALMAYAATSVTADSVRRAERRVDSVRRSAMIRREIYAWLSAAKLPRDTAGTEGFGAIDATNGAEPDDKLVFPTLRANPFNGTPATIRLFIDRDPATPERGFVAWLQGPGTAAERIEVAPEATGLSARFLFHLPGEGDRWFNGWNSRVRLPEAAQIQLYGDSLPLLLRLPVTVPLERL